jgi:hypothetical protein
MNWKLIAKAILGGSLMTFSGLVLAEPVTAFIAANSAMISAVGTAISVIGALNQGQQAADAARYNTAVAQNNAIAARQQAEANAAAQARKARLQLGSIRAGYGASGVALEGSPLDVIEASAAAAELDRQNILYSGELRAGGYESTAGLELMRGDSAKTGSYFSAGSALLKGAAGMGAFDKKGAVDSDTLYFDDWNTGSNMRRTG